jgi:hypothetical protein
MRFCVTGATGEAVRCARNKQSARYMSRSHSRLVVFNNTIRERTQTDDMANLAERMRQQQQREIEELHQPHYEPMWTELLKSSPFTSSKTVGLSVVAKALGCQHAGTNLPEEWRIAVGRAIQWLQGQGFVVKLVQRVPCGRDSDGPCYEDGVFVSWAAQPANNV